MSDVTLRLAMYLLIWQLHIYRKNEQFLHTGDLRHAILERSASE